MKTKKYAVLGFLLMALMINVVSLVLATNGGDVGGWIDVDVLCAEDEEFREDPGNRDRALQDIGQANYESEGECFERTFSIRFHVRGWVEWYSDDLVHNPASMAAQAWTQTGFEDGMEYNGYIIDMLCAFTGQYIEGKYAVTFPDANITLVNEEVADNYRAFRHEFSHQFYCPECNDWCVMNPGLVHGLITVDSWCDDCEAWINEHKYKWPTDYHLNIYSTPHGTTDPAPGSHVYREGTSVTVTASAYSHYIFRFWGFDGAIVYDNPIDVAMTSDHTLDALFIFVNHQPEIPSTPSGPTSGGIGGTYFYSTNTTDLDDDDVLYQFDWGDGTNTTTGFYASGITVEAFHSWSDLGTYCVRVRAQDSYGRWSNDWSSSVEVTISTGGGGGPYRHILN